MRKPNDAVSQIANAYKSELDLWFRGRLSEVKGIGEWLPWIRNVENVLPNEVNTEPCDGGFLFNYRLFSNLEFDESWPNRHDPKLSKIRLAFRGRFKLGRGGRVTTRRAMAIVFKALLARKPLRRGNTTIRMGIKDCQFISGTSAIGWEPFDRAVKRVVDEESWCREFWAFGETADTGDTCAA